MVTLYVLKGKAGKRYVGITNDLSRRLSEHRSRHSKAGQIIGKFTVIHTESFTDHKSARIKEKFLKSGQGRKWLDKLETESEPAIKQAGRASSISFNSGTPPFYQKYLFKLYLQII